jgi:hypothetical protein
VKPIASRQEIANRHEFCEDLSTARTDKALFGLALGARDDDSLNRPICLVYVGSKAPLSPSMEN